MATKKGILQPKIDAAGMPGFLLWARRDAKPLYSALVAKFPQVAAFEEQYKTAVDPEVGLSGFMDVLGSGLSSAASAIGSFVANNAGSIFSAAAGYAVASQQAKVAQTQLKLAQAAQPPAQTAIVQTPNGPVSVPVQPSGTGYTYAQYMQASQPSTGIMASLSRVSPIIWIAGAGALATVLLLFKRR
jgi:hypothetical protein